MAQTLASAFTLVVGMLLGLPLLLALLASRFQTNEVDVVQPPFRGALTAVTTSRLEAAGLSADLAAAVSRAIRDALRPALPPPPLSTSVASTLGVPVNRSGNRLYLALGCLGISAVAAFMGWYQLSGNPNVNEQLPYLASAGVVVVMASVIGGALLVADQLRGDDGRLEAIEDAVRELAAVLAPTIEAPARKCQDESPTPPRRAADGIPEVQPRAEDLLGQAAASRTKARTGAGR